jgi:hypothetical protein
MSAVSPSLEPTQGGSKKLPWVAPITTFVLAGASQAIVSFELNKWALMLLLGCGALGVLLQFIPQSAQTWDPLPGSSHATLKQMVAITRVLVYIGLIALPGIIFMTSKPFRDMLPPQIESYISSQVDSQNRSDDLFVFLPKKQEDVRPSLYVGMYKIKKVSETNGVGDGGIKASSPGIKGELYVLQTSQIVRNMFEDELLPMIYLVASGLVVVLALFVGAIFFMELVGGIMSEQRAR